MKVYIASSFSLLFKIREVEQVLENAGFTVICKWWTGLDFIPSERKTLKEYAKHANSSDFYSHSSCKSAYERDFQSVKDADIFIFVADDVARAYNGANIELGIALGDNKPCFSIGKLENSALYYPVVKCLDSRELLTKLEVFFAT